MTLLTSITLFTLSWLGFVGGWALSFIAREEISAGRKYLQWLSRIVFVMVIVLVGYFPWKEGNVLLAGIVTVLGASFLLWEWKWPTWWQPFLVPVMVSILFFNGTIPQSLLASLLFLYGLPTGTLLSTPTKAVKKVVK